MRVKKRDTRDIRKDFSFAYAEIRQHVGHEIACVVYGDEDNTAIECETCSAVILDINGDE